jgi:hypothetical protein
VALTLLSVEERLLLIEASSPLQGLSRLQKLVLAVAMQVWIFPKGTEMSRCEEEATGMFLLIQGKARSYPGAPALYSKLPNAWFDLEVMQCVAHCILHAAEIRDILLRCPSFTQRK